jgi:L-ascorbate metabolism protein UlaG (beta-lactamase superfamily)
MICITHDHFDHCSPDDIKKIISSKTIIVATPPCSDQLKDLQIKNLKLVKPGDELEIDTIKISVVPAYNVNKYRAPGKVYHPEEELKVGYILRVGQTSIYHAGDTDLIPDMAGIDVDVALLPVSGTFVMTAEEAAQATKMMKAKVAIPMHYGAIVGDESNAKRFRELATGKVEILKKE